jgi:biopolymer transport protein ExbB/TolQ
MSRSAPAARATRSGILASVGPFLVGIPLGIGLLVLCAPKGPLYHEQVHRYMEHTAEQAAIVLFCCALSALTGKLLIFLKERAACGQGLLTPWDGQAIPAAAALAMLKTLEARPRWWLKTTLGRRIAGILDFVASRGSANDLDDQMRCLADNDALALETSYSLLRFINWAIPILGFLGTVLGITQAISGVTPEQLEHSLSGVTDGLSQAFDTTALGLFLTMILMLLCFLVERVEAGILEIVDRYVDMELAHRFLHTGAESGPFIQAVQQNAQVLLGATQELVEKQAAVWTVALEKADRQWSQGGARQQEGMTAALQTAMEHALTRYGQRLAELEGHLLQRNQALLDGLNKLAQTLQSTGREHQLALARLTDALGMQMQTLAQVSSGEEKLVRLQQSLSQNLEVLASAGTLEQVVQSLTAAIHLLTTRTGGPPVPPRLARAEAA